MSITMNSHVLKLNGHVLKWIIAGVVVVASFVGLQAQVSRNSDELTEKADRAVVQVQLQAIQNQLNRIEAKLP